MHIKKLSKTFLVNIKELFKKLFDRIRTKTSSQLRNRHDTSAPNGNR